MAPEKQSDSDGDSPEPAQKTSSSRRANGGISSGGGISGSGRGMPDDRKKCYRCGQTGHVRGQCPQKQDGILDAVKKARG
jgi:Zinc knuckle